MFKSNGKPTYESMSCLFVRKSVFFLLQNEMAFFIQSIYVFIEINILLYIQKHEKNANHFLKRRRKSVGRKTTQSNHQIELSDSSIFYC